jgi:hypothetical protein
VRSGLVAKAFLAIAEAMVAKNVCVPGGQRRP